MAARDTRSSARRRRERRLRAQWRHEQQTVAMALAAATHHSAQRGEWRDLHEAPRGQRTASAEATFDALRRQTTSVARDTEFFSLYEEELGGTRPDRLYEVRPQDRIQRRIVEQIVDNTLFVPTLDVPVPQMENQLVEVCWLLDILIPEQAIEVPKISSSRRSRRCRVRFAEQMAEQLVEVPTIISYSSLHGFVEQNVVVSVVDVFSVHTQDRVQQRLVEQSIFQQRLPSRSLTFQFRVEAEFFILHRRLLVCRVRQINGFFRTFSVRKKCTVGSTPGVGTGCGLYFIHVVGSAGGFLHGRSWCVDAVSRWLVETSGLGSRSLAAWVMAGTEPSSCVSRRMLLEEFPGLCARAVRTWNLVHYFRCPFFWQLLFPASGYC